MANKEFITRNLIEKDLRKRYTHQIGEMIISFILIFVVKIILFNLLRLFFNMSTPMERTLAIGIYIVLGLMWTYDFVILLISFIVLRHKKYRIETAWVTSKKTKRLHTRASAGNPHILIFNRKHKYFIPTGPNYIWSERYRKSDDAIFESTAITDEFYIVRTNPFRIDAVYSKKWFEIDV